MFKYLYHYKMRFILRAPTDRRVDCEIFVETNDFPDRNIVKAFMIKRISTDTRPELFRVGCKRVPATKFKDVLPFKYPMDFV